VSTRPPPGALAGHCAGVACGSSARSPSPWASRGPTAGVIIGPAIIAGIVGEPGALAEVLALVAMGFVAYAFVVFTRAFNTAGSVYAFNATALGPGYGFVSAWPLLLV